jgi:uncharacterized protein involved in exopolysaccharide biosynthesis
MTVPTRRPERRSVRVEDQDGYVDDRIEVQALLRRLRRGWLTIALCAVVGLAIAATYLHLATYRYVAEMRVSPVQGSGAEGLSSKLGQLGGLAAAAGVSIPDSAGGSSFRLYVEALQSRDIADRLVTDGVLMRQAFEREWDPVQRRWRRPDSAIRLIAAPFKALLGVPAYDWHPPTADRMKEFLQKNVLIDQNPKTPVVTITMLHENPAFAMRLLTELNATVDDMLRQRTLLRTNDYIAYLSAKLGTVTLQEQRNAITNALGEQERIKMAASSTRPFAAEMFEAPSVSDRPLSPAPYKILAIALLLGIAVGVVLALLRRDRTIAVLDEAPAA